MTVTNSPIAQTSNHRLTLLCQFLHSFILCSLAFYLAPMFVCPLSLHKCTCDPLLMITGLFFVLLMKPVRAKRPVNLCVSLFSVQSFLQNVYEFSSKTRLTCLTLSQPGRAHIAPPPPFHQVNFLKNILRMPRATDLKLSDNLNELICITKIIFQPPPPTLHSLSNLQSGRIFLKNIFWQFSCKSSPVYKVFRKWFYCALSWLQTLL